MSRMINCIKLNKELPGLDFPPFKGELGERLYFQVSKEAWETWLAHSVIVINEYRLNPATPDGQAHLMMELERFFFEEGTAPVLAPSCQS